MIAWPAKDPAETLDYSWIVPLDDGDTIATHTAVVTSGGVAINSSAISGGSVRVWVGGGIADQISYLNLTAVTAGGRTFREVACLPVIDRASAVLVQFRLMCPGLSAIDDGAISYRLAKVASTVGDAWPEAHRTDARIYLAAHQLAEANGEGSAGLTSFKSGDFSATISDTAAQRTGLQATLYGRAFDDLRRSLFTGVMLAWEPPCV